MTTRTKGPKTVKEWREFARMVAERLEDAGPHGLDGEACRYWANEIRYATGDHDYYRNDPK